MSELMTVADVLRRFGDSNRVVSASITVIAWDTPDKTAVEAVQEWLIANWVYE